MGLKLVSIQMMLPALLAARERPDARILLLGKQDLYFTYDQVAAFLRSQNVSFTDIPPDERRLTDSFGFVPHQDWWQFRNFLHQETLLRMFGFASANIHTLDVDDYEGAEIIHDMNLPVPENRHGAYDLVIDTGTIEHVFDVKQGFWNLHDLTKVGGWVYHMSPANMLDHGFINLSATILEDFYGQSGWIQEELFYVASSKIDIGNSIAAVRIAANVYDIPPPDLYLGVVGRFRKTETAIKVIPKQGLYQNLHDAWTRQSRAQSRHEAPPKKRGDGLRAAIKDYASRLRRLRVLWVLARLKGEVVDIRQPFSD